MAKRRDYGTGAVYVRGPSWHGRWYDAEGNRIQRKLGRVRTEGNADGLTKVMAEERLRELRAETGRLVSLEGRVTVEQAGEQHCARLALRGRKKSHQMTVASDLRNHISPFFASKTLDQIKPVDIEKYIAAKQRSAGVGRTGLSIKTIRNHVNTIHSVFELGIRQGWCVSNPVKLADRPVIKKTETRIQFLGLDELEKLVSTPYPDSVFARVDPALFLTAAMTGLRQGELLALRWRDVDFKSQRIRVVENYVRGQFDKPKSEKSSRSVPMASKVAVALLDLHDRTDFPRAGDLVFGHPELGGPLDRSKLIRRFKQARERAEVRPITFHDLRHTFGTTMAAAGEPQRNIQEWMGHDDLKTTQVYMHYAPRHNEVEAVDRAFS